MGHYFLDTQYDLTAKKLRWRCNPYLKILDLKNLFVADAPVKKKSKHLVLPPLRELYKIGPKTARA